MKTTKKITTKTTLAQIAEMAHEDGFLNLSRRTCAAIKRACASGSCLWTTEKIVTTDISRLSIAPGANASAGNNTDYGNVEFSHIDDAISFYGKFLVERPRAGNKYHAWCRENRGDRESLV